jgi:hypothetical protein
VSASSTPQSHVKFCADTSRSSTVHSRNACSLQTRLFSIARETCAFSLHDALPIPCCYNTTLLPPSHICSANDTAVSGFIPAEQSNFRLSHCDVICKGLCMPQHYNILRLDVTAGTELQCCGASTDCGNARRCRHRSHWPERLSTSRLSSSWARAAH